MSFQQQNVKFLVVDNFCSFLFPEGGGGGQGGVKFPSPYGFLSQFLPPPYFFEPISPSSLNGYVSFFPLPYFSPLYLPPPNFVWAISPSSPFCSSPLPEGKLLVVDKVEFSHLTVNNLSHRLSFLLGDNIWLSITNRFSTTKCLVRGRP